MKLNSEKERTFWNKIFKDISLSAKHLEERNVPSETPARWSPLAPPGQQHRGRFLWADLYVYLKIDQGRWDQWISPTGEGKRNARWSCDSWDLEKKINK